MIWRYVVWDFLYCLWEGGMITSELQSGGIPGEGGRERKREWTRWIIASGAQSKSDIPRLIYLVLSAITIPPNRSGTWGCVVCSLSRRWWFGARIFPGGNSVSFLENGLERGVLGLCGGTFARVPIFRTLFSLFDDKDVVLWWWSFGRFVWRVLC